MPIPAQPFRTIARSTGSTDARLDPRTRQMRSLLGWIAVAAIVVGSIEAIAGASFGEGRSIVIGIGAVCYGVWVSMIARGSGSQALDVTIGRLAAVTLGLILAAAILEPAVSPGMAIASVLPAVLVLPFVTGRAVRNVLVLAGLVGIGSMIAGEIVPRSDRIPVALVATLSSTVFLLAFGFLLVSLWEVGRRLKSAAEDLGSIVAMSSDLSSTMDPQLVGDRIAQHIAQAVGANDCALSYWDHAGDQLVTLGYYPPARRGTLQPSYALADYPATRTVLEEARPAIIDVLDPAADPREVAYLRSISQRSMAIVPLVAAGTTIGTLELTSDRDGAFESRHVHVASMLAGEAAMALENARLYDEIRHQALHDGLTGLANRVLFRDRVGQALERSHGRTQHPFAILFIDLDDFKVLNDTLGHARGDDVLVAAAQRVAASLRPADTAARFGGDEFAVLLEEVGDEETALSIAIRLADALREPIDLGDMSPAIAASIGVAVSGTPGETADDLLGKADVAMYAAKSTSRGRAQLFRASLRADAAARSELAAELRGVEQRGELRLDYQPIVELATTDVVGLEALVRWQPPDRPLLMPNDFIDLAEETGDIVPMGRWILREACRQTREWQVRLGLPDLHVTVNLSAREFQEHDLLETIGSALQETGLPAENLTIEITESGLMQRTSGTIARLEALRDLGVHLAIDDFGTGYSSLSYLERFPVDILKIDRSFIGANSASGERSAIARAIVELGRTLGLTVVAEGIEQADQADWLRELGCPLGQGYLFSRPLGVDATEAFLAADATRRIQSAGGDPGDAAAPTGRARRARGRRLRLVSGD
jgi:diguanylate cyclase (GGDEF)-like protein